MNSALYVELASVEVDKALVMLESVEELNQIRLYTEEDKKDSLGGSGVAKKREGVIDKIKNLISKIKEWLRNKFSKPKVVEIPKEDEKKVSKFKKILTKLKTSAKKHPVWATLIALFSINIVASVVIGTVAAYKMIKISTQVFDDIYDLADDVMKNKADYAAEAEAFNKEMAVKAEAFNKEMAAKTEEFKSFNESFNKEMAAMRNGLNYTFSVAKNAKPVE